MQKYSLKPSPAKVSGFKAGPPGQGHPQQDSKRFNGRRPRTCNRRFRNDSCSSISLRCSLNRRLTVGGKSLSMPGRNSLRVIVLAEDRLAGRLGPDLEPIPQAASARPGAGPGFRSSTARHVVLASSSATRLADSHQGPNTSRTRDTGRSATPWPGIWSAASFGSTAPSGRTRTAMSRSISVLSPARSVTMYEATRSGPSIVSSTRTASRWSSRGHSDCLRTQRIAAWASG